MIKQSRKRPKIKSTKAEIDRVIRASIKTTALLYEESSNSKYESRYKTYS